jgi:hypothetical protein
MKWYTRQWQRGDLSDAESDRRDVEYRAYVASIADRIPPHLLSFALPENEHMSVDDGYLDLAEFDAGRVLLRLVNGSLQSGYGHFEIEMTGVTSIEPGADELRPILASPGTEFLRQEVHLLDDVAIEVAFLLWPEGEFAVRCSDLRTAWRATASRDDHRNAVVVHAGASSDIAER